MRLKVVRLEEGMVQVACEGEILQLDFIDPPNPLEPMLGPAGFGQAVVIDLSGVIFMGSSGVGWLVVCHRECLKAGGVVVLHSIPQRLEKVFELVKLKDHLRIAEDLESALRMVADWRSSLMTTSTNSGGAVAESGEGV